MVDALNLPKQPKRMSKTDLEWWILFGIAVAGKGAKQTQEKMRVFLSDIPNPRISGSTTSDTVMAEFRKTATPFERVRYLISEGKLLSQMRKHKLGKYKLFNKAFRSAIKLDLDTITVEALEQIPGIGPKTARMVAMYGFPDTCGDVAVLDTHILKWLRLKGYNAPKSTPQAGKKYLTLEQAFIAEAKKEGKTPAELDTEIWQAYAIKPGFTDSYEQSA